MAFFWPGRGRKGTRVWSSVIKRMKNVVKIQFLKQFLKTKKDIET